MLHVLHVLHVLPVLHVPLLASVHSCVCVPAAAPDTDRTPGSMAAVERRPSVAFLTALNDGGGGSDERRPSSQSNTNNNNNNDPTTTATTTDSASTSTGPSPASETLAPAGGGCAASDTGSNSRGESLLSRGESRRGRDVKSAEVDLVGYQPLPDSVDLCSVTEKVCTASNHSIGRINSSVELGATHTQARLAFFVHARLDTIKSTTDGSYCYCILWDPTALPFWYS